MWAAVSMVDLSLTGSCAPWDVGTQARLRSSQQADVDAGLTETASTATTLEMGTIILMTDAW